MSDNNLETQLEMERRVSCLETTSKEHEKKIDKLDEIKDAVIGIKAFLEFSKEDSQKRDNLIAQQSEVLNQISNKLTGVENKVDDLDAQVCELKDKSTIKIDILAILKKAFMFFILPAGGLAALISGIIYIINLFKQ